MLTSTSKKGRSQGGGQDIVREKGTERGLVFAFKLLGLNLENVKNLLPDPSCKPIQAEQMFVLAPKAQRRWRA